MDRSARLQMAALLSHQPLKCLWGFAPMELPWRTCCGAGRRASVACAHHYTAALATVRVARLADLLATCCCQSCCVPYPCQGPALPLCRWLELKEYMASLGYAAVVQVWTDDDASVPGPGPGLG